jgi:hypothetical protein
VSSLSEAVGNITRALQSNADMYNNSVIVFFGDNGGGDVQCTYS